MNVNIKNVKFIEANGKFMKISYRCVNNKHN